MVSKCQIDQWFSTGGLQICSNKGCGKTMLMLKCKMQKKKKKKYLFQQKKSSLDKSQTPTCAGSVTRPHPQTP